MRDATTRLRAAIDYLRRKIDGYDSTFETAEEIATGAVDLRGIAPVATVNSADVNIESERDAYRAMLCDLLAAAQLPTGHPTFARQLSRARELLKNGATP